MGKRNKKRMNKMKFSKKASSIKRKAEAASASYAEVKTDGEKIPEDGQSSDEIQEPDDFPLIMTEETNEKESRNISIEDNVTEQSSQSEASGKTVKDITEMLFAIDESLVIDKCARELESEYLAGNISPTQFLHESNALAERHRNVCRLLDSQNRQLVENTEKHVISKKQEGIPYPSNILKSSNEKPETEKFEISKGTDDGSEENESELENIEDDIDGMIADLENDREENVQLNYMDISVEDIERALRSSQSSSLAERHRNICKLLDSQNRQLVENTEKHVISKEQEGIPYPSNILESSNKKPETEKLEISKGTDDGSKENELELENIEDDIDVMIADLENDRGKNVQLNYMDISVEDIERALRSSQLWINEKKDKIDCEKYTGNNQKTEKNPHNLDLECDDEILKKIVDVTDETVHESTDKSGMNDMKEMVQEIPRQNKPYKSRIEEFQDFLEVYVSSLHFKSDKILDEERPLIRRLINTLSKGQSIFFSKSSPIDSNTKILEVKASKKQQYKMNDIIAELRKFETKEHKNSADNVEVIEESLQNAIEDKKEEKQGKENYDRSNDNVMDSHSSKETLTAMEQFEGCERKDEAKDHEKILKADFQRDLKEFMTIQNSKMDERVRKYRDMMGSEEKSTIKQLDPCFSEKGPLIPDLKTKSHQKDKKISDEKNEESATTAEQSEIPEIEIDKNEEIHFEIEIDGTQHIFAGTDYFHVKNKTVTFNFKDENIQASLSGYQISISTPKSEFDISIRNDIRYLKRKSHPFNLSDEATQTDDLQ